MKEKKGGFLRWPWNVVVYVLLVLVFGIFAIPIILILMGIQRKNNPHGISEGYCLSRTRKRLVWLVWALLVLVVSASLFVLLKVGLEQDRAYWETMDYVTLAVCGIGGPLLLIGGIYLGYTAVRDSFFPEKSYLAKSIRSQLPYPEEAPPVEQLFAMVDQDLRENGQWFGPVGIGREWVLGDGVNKIDRIRGIFVINEIHQHHTQTGVRTSRRMELVLIDDRWQRTSTSFNDLRDLEAAADYLALRVPDARQGNGNQCASFWTMDEVARDAFEREFRQKQSLRASEAAQREFLRGESQDMILKCGTQATSRVTLALVEEHLRRCLEGTGEEFTLTPTRPVEGSGRILREMSVSSRNGTVTLKAELVTRTGEQRVGFLKNMDYQEALAVLEDWLSLKAPRLESWEMGLVYGFGSAKDQDRQPRKSLAKLSLIYASGAAENHTTFTQEDIQVAAEGIVDGTYQLVDLTHPSGYLWIRVTAGDRVDGRCTVEATKPSGETLEFYMAKMSSREAAQWLLGYPHGSFMPGGREWKRVKKPGG